MQNTNTKKKSQSTTITAYFGIYLVNSHTKIQFEIN
jgi:hypothetical protein